MTNIIITQTLLTNTLLTSTLVSQSSVKKLFTICCLVFGIASGGMFGAEKNTITITQELLTEKINNTTDNRALLFFRASRDALQYNHPSYKSLFKAAECVLKIHTLTDAHAQTLLEQAIQHYLSNQEHSGDHISDLYL
jgi:hypothetical protein